MTTHLFPPGPKGHLLLGNLPEVRADPLHFLTDCAQEYGDIVHYRILNNHVYLLSHPDYIESVLSVHHRDVTKGRVYRANRHLFGNGLLTSEGSGWQLHRHMIQPAFHREAIAAYGETVVEYTQCLLGRWRDGDVFDICEEMKRLGLQIVARVLFSTDVSDQTNELCEALGIVWEQFAARVNAGLLLPEGIPTPSNIRLRRAINRMERILNKIIREHRENDSNTGDLLHMLLKAKDENGAPMDDRQILDEVKTLIVAGHETGALALSWTFYLLSQYPAVELRLLEELETVLHGRPPVVAHLPRLRYTEMILKESMRMYPVVWSISRVALADIELGGYQIPAGASLVTSQWVMHHDPRYFPRPYEFDPDRWKPESADSLPRFAYFPFGGGPRRCIGHAFAMMELVLILATIVQEFRFTPVQLARPEPIPSFITLAPKYGLRMIAASRR
jgi:cytochrome P450